MSHWVACPNGCGKEVRAYWEEGIGYVASSTGCLWCEGSRDSGAAIAFGLMGMAFAIRRMTGVEDSPHTPCSYCGARVEHFGTGCPVCNMFRKWEGFPD